MANNNWTAADEQDVRYSVMIFMQGVLDDVMDGNMPIEDEGWRLPAQMLGYFDGSGYNTDPALLQHVLQQLVTEGQLQKEGSMYCMPQAAWSAHPNHMPT